MKRKQPKKGNKYQVFSKSGKEGAVGQEKKTMGSCPSCDCCKSKVLNNKPSLCLNCHDGLHGHKKMGKPKIS